MVNSFKKGWLCAGQRKRNEAGKGHAAGFIDDSETMSFGHGYGRRLAPVLAGLRNPGQRSLEIAVAGSANAADDEPGAREELEKLILLKQ